MTKPNGTAWAFMGGIAAFVGIVTLIVVMMGRLESKIDRLRDNDIFHLSEDVKELSQRITRVETLLEAKE